MMTRHSVWLRLMLLSIAALLPMSLLSAPATAAPSAEQRYGNSAFRATNHERADRGVRPVKKNSCLKRFAVKHARKMANQRRLFHQPLGPILRRCRLSQVGENVAYGFPSGSAVVAGWMRSTHGHREQVLNGRYRQVGIAARRAGNGRWYVSQVFGRRF